MFAGTGSDVGKSIVAAAFCRIFLQDGYAPAPFKAQNMALNSYATPDGLEIGRAQAVQAEAAGIPCHTDMNPLLLKPQSDHTSQVVLHGKPLGKKTPTISGAKALHSVVQPIACNKIRPRRHRSISVVRCATPSTVWLPIITPSRWREQAVSRKST